MKNKLKEGLHTGDLEDLVLKVISIDEYQSKIGDDKDIVVIAFYVKDQDPANDLMRFISKSEVSLLDVDISPAPNKSGYYLVFVEFSRDHKFIPSMVRLLGTLAGITGIKDWQFKPYHNEKVHDLTEDNLKKYVKLPKDTFQEAKEWVDRFRDKFPTYQGLDKIKKI